VKTYAELKALIEQRGVHAEFGAPGEGWGIEQNPDELARFLVVCQELGVESVLEIGTGYKAGLARFLTDDMGWQVVSVDIHDYGHYADHIRFMQLDNVPTISEPFDLVFIDADHAYVSVKADHARWGHAATKLIAFHDICGLRDCAGAAWYWQEIAIAEFTNTGHTLNPDCYEIIADGDTRSGIGWIDLSVRK